MSRNPQKEASMCSVRAKLMPPWMGRNAHTWLERITPLTISPSISRSTSASTTIWNTRKGVYFPRNRLLYHPPLRI